MWNCRSVEMPYVSGSQSSGSPGWGPRIRTSNKFPCDAAAGPPPPHTRWELLSHVERIKNVWHLLVLLRKSVELISYMLFLGSTETYNFDSRLGGSYWKCKWYSRNPKRTPKGFLVPRRTWSHQAGLLIESGDPLLNWTRAPLWFPTFSGMGLLKGRALDRKQGLGAMCWEGIGEWPRAHTVLGGRWENGPSNLTGSLHPLSFPEENSGSDGVWASLTTFQRANPTQGRARASAYYIKRVAVCPFPTPGRWEVRGDKTTSPTPDKDIKERKQN